LRQESESTVDKRVEIADKRAKELDKSRGFWSFAGKFAIAYALIRLFYDFIIYGEAWELMIQWSINRWERQLSPFFAWVQEYGSRWTEYFRGYLDWGIWGFLFGGFLWLLTCVLWLAAVITAIILIGMFIGAVRSEYTDSLKPLITGFSAIVLLNACVIFNEWIMSWWGLTLFAFWLIASLAAAVIISFKEIWAVLDYNVLNRPTHR
jgi:hypothetical protein